MEIQDDGQKIFLSWVKQIEKRADQMEARADHILAAIDHYETETEGEKVERSIHDLWSLTFDLIKLWRNRPDLRHHFMGKPELSSLCEAASHLPFLASVAKCQAEVRHDVR